MNKLIFGAQIPVQDLADVVYKLAVLAEEIAEGHGQDQDIELYEETMQDSSLLNQMSAELKQCKGTVRIPLNEGSQKLLPSFDPDLVQEYLGYHQSRLESELLEKEKLLSYIRRIRHLLGPNPDSSLFAPGDVVRSRKHEEVIPYKVVKQVGGAVKCINLLDTYEYTIPADDLYLWALKPQV